MNAIHLSRAVIPANEQPTIEAAKQRCRDAGYTPSGWYDSDTHEAYIDSVEIAPNTMGGSKWGMLIRDCRKPLPA
jgi:hypothetical protein